MEFELAKTFMQELSAAGASLNRLHGLAATHIPGEEVQKEFRRNLGEVMGILATLQLNIARIHPRLDPDEGEQSGRRSI